MKIQIAMYTKGYEHDNWGADGIIDIYEDEGKIVFEGVYDKIAVDKDELGQAVQLLCPRKVQK